MPNILNNFLTRFARRVARWAYGAGEALLVSRRYRDDQHYIANKDVAKCFENRIDSTGDDSVLLRRIASAYQKASRDLAQRPALFRPSNDWLPIYKLHYKEVMQALDGGDIDKLDAIYRNFWREPCSTGLVGLPVDMAKHYFRKDKKINFVDRALFLNDAVHRLQLWKKLLGHRFDATALLAPTIGNPYGCFVDGNFIKTGADYQHYYATRISDLLGNSQDRKIAAEIGGGFGGMAYYLIRDGANVTYVDFDLPENLALTSYYLMKAFPEKKVLLYGEADILGTDLSGYDAVLMPNFEMDRFPDGACDLVFNSYSFSEMAFDTVEHFLSRAGQMTKAGGWLFHVNHTSDKFTSAKKFPIPAHYELIREEFAAWNLGRNTKMDEFEFLYKRN